MAKSECDPKGRGEHQHSGAEQDPEKEPHAACVGARRFAHARVHLRTGSSSSGLSRDSPRTYHRKQLSETFSKATRSLRRSPRGTQGCRRVKREIPCAGMTHGAAKAAPRLGECGGDSFLQQLSILWSSRAAV